MGDADRRVVAPEEGCQCAVNQRLRLCVESGRRFVQNENVRILDESTGNSDALLLPARQLGASCAYLGVKTVWLRGALVRLVNIKLR